MNPCSVGGTSTLDPFSWRGWPGPLASFRAGPLRPPEAPPPQCLCRAPVFPGVTSAVTSKSLGRSLCLPPLRLLNLPTTILGITPFLDPLELPPAHSLQRLGQALPCSSLTLGSCVASAFSVRPFLKTPGAGPHLSRAAAQSGQPGTRWPRSGFCWPLRLGGRPFHTPRSAVSVPKGSTGSQPLWKQTVMWRVG